MIDSIIESKQESSGTEPAKLDAPPTLLVPLPDGVLVTPIPWKNWRPLVSSLKNVVIALFCLVFLAGCAGNEDWIRLRPDAKSPFSGVEQPMAKPYTGQVSVIYGTYDDYEDNPQNLSDVDGFGLWVSARPSEWYIAPEIGYLNATEDDGALGEIDNSEFFFGGRVTAELPFTPFSVIGGGGISQLKVREYSFNADESGVYFHAGALLHNITTNFYIFSNDNIRFNGYIFSNFSII